MTTPTPRIQRLEGTIKVMAPPMGNPKGMSVVREATCVMVDELDQLERDLAAAQEWREAVLNELIVAHSYTKEHDTNPRKAIQDAITWHCQVALDPAVSSDAQRLRDTHLQRAEAADYRANQAEIQRKASDEARDRSSVLASEQIVRAEKLAFEKLMAERKAEEAARDSTRLDWMIEHGTDEGGGSGFEFRVYIPHDSECLRDAIDAAIAAKGEA